MHLPVVMNSIPALATDPESLRRAIASTDTLAAPHALRCLGCLCVLTCFPKIRDGRRTKCQGGPPSQDLRDRSRVRLLSLTSCLGNNTTGAAPQIMIVGF